MSRTRIIAFDEPALWAGKPDHGKTVWELPEDLTDAWYVTEFESPAAQIAVEQALIRHNMGAVVKLWHDDVRLPPDSSWVRVRRNSEAIAVLSAVPVNVLSMDHDLGGADIPDHDLEAQGDYRNYIRADSPNGTTGVDLARWIGVHDRYPNKIIIHSMNVVGSSNIAAELMRWSENSDSTCEIQIVPFA